MTGMELRLTGLPASAGVAIGRMTHFSTDAGARRRLNDRPLALDALNGALAASLVELRALEQSLEGAAAEIITFQIAVLEDPEFCKQASSAIAAGATADSAWMTVLDKEIAAFAGSGDEHFRARAVDLVDIRDRVLRRLRGQPEPRRFPPGAVVVADDLPPSIFLRTDWSQGGGIALRAGSPSSHVATLARAQGIPMVVGLGAATPGGPGLTIVDGTNGTVTVAPAPETLARVRDWAAAEERRQQSARARRVDPAVTKDGQHVAFLINVSKLSDLSGVDAACCDGIGLVRTEFLIGQALSDEQRQYDCYVRLVRWAAGKPVTIRTIDGGGDKPMHGYTRDREKNPFLGLRGIRLSLLKPDVFRVQLRAIARAAALGPVRILLPMVSLADEITQARGHLSAVMDELGRDGVAHGRPSLGMMVEVPAAAMAPDLYDVEFMSIGSNDLAQYAMAAARDNPDVVSSTGVPHPGLLAMIANVARYGRERGVEVSLCGDAGADPVGLPHLLKAGIRRLSVAPALLPVAKDAVRKLDLSAMARGTA
jgi:phosphoenolpyruvate-protein phosphotransferase (PTS system enzyme I)